MNAPRSSEACVVVVMGVSGCGKTTVARGLAAARGGVHLEGDDFHPPANKAKMAAGIPLDDEDRGPWLDALREAARGEIERGREPVLSCSALKRSHRARLLRGFQRPRLVHLAGPFELIRSRMDAREHEYMTSALLRSQFEALEAPEPGPGVLELSIERPPRELVSDILAWLDADDSETWEESSSSAEAP